MAAGTAYAKRYGGGFLDLPTTSTPIDSAFLNAVEAALLQLIGAAPTADGQVAQWDNANTRFGPALILNKNVDPAAAIAYSKLNLAAAIKNTDLDPSVLKNDVAVSINAANTDLGTPTGVLNYLSVTTATNGTSTLRSIGTPTTGAGTRLLLRNNTTAYIRLLHATAGGTGKQLAIIGAGHKFLAPQQTIEFVYDGTNWQEIDRPARELICDSLLGGGGTFDTDTILGVASGIPQVYSHLEFVVTGRSVIVAGADTPSLVINNDGGANYERQLFYGDAAASSSAFQAAQTSVVLGITPGTTNPATFSSVCEVSLPDYRSTTFYKEILSVFHGAYNGGTTARSGIYGTAWKSTSAINRLSVSNSGNNFTAGSRFSLYGVT